MLIGARLLSQDFLDGRLQLLARANPLQGPLFDKPLPLLSAESPW